MRCELSHFARAAIKPMLPTDSIRAFLATQGIALAASHAAIDQSVVRAICVRK